VSDRVKPSFVIFDILALWRSAVSVSGPCLNDAKCSRDPYRCDCAPGFRVPWCQKNKWRLKPGLAQVLYSCTHTATVGVKGLDHNLCPWKVSLDRLTACSLQTVCVTIDDFLPHPSVFCFSITHGSKTDCL